MPRERLIKALRATLIGSRQDYLVVMPTVIIRWMAFSIVGFNRDDSRNKSLYIFDGRALVAGMICSHRTK